MLDREQRVREIAYRLWEEGGRPTDQEKRHWAVAERVFDSEGVSSAGLELPSEEAQKAARPAVASKRRAERKNSKRVATGPHGAATLSR